MTLDDIEEGLALLYAGEREVQLPHSIKSNAAGTETALVQLIITWARTGGEGARLRLYSTPDDNAGQQNFAHTVWGLTALNMAHNVAARSGEELDRFALLTLAREYVIAMAEKPISVLKQFDQKSLPFLCIDNARNYRRPSRLYVPGTDRVRGRSDFVSLVKSCASSLPGTRRIRHSDLEASGSLLYEAFQNTHDHAQTSFSGELLRRSVRGLIISFRYVHLNILAKAGGGSVPLSHYFADWRPAIAHAKHAQFLELGIFDSGPGLARRWLSNDHDLAQSIPAGNNLGEEYEAIAACLRKGATTKPGHTSGNGLFRIMQVVKRLGGFIRVRTGNLSLVKPFGDSGTPLEAGDLQLLDTETGTSVVKKRAWVEGTSISVLLPTNRAMMK